MSGREREDDRTPLLGHNNHDTFHHRERGDLPLWRHILENKMTWAWYNAVISSGAVSLLLFDLPYGTNRLWILGAIVYVFSLVLFLVTFLTHIVRFMVRPSLVPTSIKHPVEGLHVSSFPAALGILILNGATYAEKMHGYSSRALRTFYWIYIALSVVFSIGSPIAQFSNTTGQNRRARDFAPATLTPTLPLLLAGPTAAVVLAHLNPSHHRAALGIISFGAALQGAGLLLSLFQQSSILSRLHADGFPTPRERPALFLATLPAALSAWAAGALAQQALRHFPVVVGEPPATVVGGVALYYFGVTTGVVLWGLAVWWFLVAVVANIMVMREVGACGDVLEWFVVVFAHAALFLANNELLRAFEWPKLLVVINEIFGVVTAVVWAVLMIGVVLGLVSGRLVRD